MNQDNNITEFEMPKAEVVLFDNKDVITTSSTDVVPWSFFGMEG